MAIPIYKVRDDMCTTCSIISTMHCLSQYRGTGEEKHMPCIAGASCKQFEIPACKSKYLVTRSMVESSLHAISEIKSLFSLTDITLFHDRVSQTYMYFQSWRHAISSSSEIKFMHEERALGYG